MTVRLRHGLCRQGLILLYVTLLTVPGQACAANNNSSKADQASSNQAAQNQELKVDADQGATEPSATSPYTPTGLVLSIDFEKQEVEPHTDKH